MHEASAFFKAISEETRIAIIFLLLQKESLCVCDFEHILKETQSKISRHLRYLVNADLLESQRKNTWVYYSLHRKLDGNKSNILQLLPSLIDELTQKFLLLQLQLRLEEKNHC